MDGRKEKLLGLGLKDVQGEGLRSTALLKLLARVQEHHILLPTPK